MKFNTLAVFVFASIFSTFSHFVDANYLKCVSNVDENVDYFPSKISPKYSQQWSITYRNTYKIITNKVVGTSYLLYQCGSTPPANETGHTMSISVPLEDGLVVASTTMIPHLEQLGLRRQIKGYIGNPSYISSDCINTLVDETSIKVLNDTYSYSQGIPLETFLEDTPNAIVLRNSNVGPNALVISENKENENLDIYEWHKVYAALFNLEETANEQFEVAEARYQCNTANAAYIAEQKGESGVTERPTIAWAYHSSWNPDNQYWDVANCDGTNMYYCEFAQRCEANLLHSNNGSIPYYGDNHMTDEEFFEFAKDADHWIYIGSDWDEKFKRFKANLKEFKSVKNGEVYDTQGSGPNAWFETRIAEFDIVLQDLCEIVGHYDNTLSHKRSYFRKVIQDVAEPIPTRGTCADGVDTPWESRASECIESVAMRFSHKLALFVSLIASMLAVFNL